MRKYIYISFSRRKDDYAICYKTYLVPSLSTFMNGAAILCLLYVVIFIQTESYICVWYNGRPATGFSLSSYAGGQKTLCTNKTFICTAASFP